MRATRASLGYCTAAGCPHARHNCAGQRNLGATRRYSLRASIIMLSKQATCDTHQQKKIQRAEREAKRENMARDSPVASSNGQTSTPRLLIGSWYHRNTKSINDVGTHHYTSSAAQVSWRASRRAAGVSIIFALIHRAVRGG